MSRPEPVSKGDALGCTGLTLAHGPCEVVVDVDLSLPQGRWIAVVGPNGAGKSTLLRGLCGLHAPRAGRVDLLGRPLSEWPLRERARRLSWLGQAEVVGEGLTVQDTVALGRLPHQGSLGLSGATPQDQAIVEECLRRTDLASAGTRRVNELSGGERQRVLLARALAVQAPVMLLDEPTTHLDAPHLRLLSRVLRERADQGDTVVAVLHDLNLALAADEIVVMARGRVQARGPTADPTVHAALESAFDGAVRVREVDGRRVAVPVDD